MAVSLYDGATEYVLACATGGTDVYRYDSDGTNEALCTISGTAIGTGATRMGYDPSTGYVYIMDGSDKASTTIRRYTFTGTTLTFVDTITLSTAPLNLGRTQMWIGANYIVIEQDTNNSLDFHRYGKDSGTEIEASMAYNFSTTQQSGQYLRHPVNLAGYLVTEIQAGADVNIFFIKFSPDDLPF
ncbi:MAG: hypothetical protein Q8Q08_12865 [Candidatus Omnitrophota bacterium]|nr:hypothetical protein [Candidatus Omnitrophota bacterium]